MSQADPPWQGERETGRFRVIATLGSRGSLAVARAPISDRSGYGRPSYFRPPATPIRMTVKFGDPPLLRRYWILGATRNRRTVFLLGTDGRLRPFGSLIPVTHEGVRQ